MKSKITQCPFKKYHKHEDCKKGLLKDPIVRESYNRELLSLMIAQQIVELRGKRKLTQKEVAAKIGVIPEYLSMLESGRKIPSTALLLKIADIFGKRLSVKFI